MFSVAQKRQIAEAVEKVLLNFHHPEMPTTKPMFHLRVEGVESWSWAEIEPNHVFDDAHKPGVNLFNEQVAAQMNAEDLSNIIQRGLALKEKN